MSIENGNSFLVQCFSNSLRRAFQRFQCWMCFSSSCLLRLSLGNSRNCCLFVMFLNLSYFPHFRCCHHSLSLARSYNHGWCVRRAWMWLHSRPTQKYVRNEQTHFKFHFCSFILYFDRMFKTYLLDSFACHHSERLLYLAGDSSGDELCSVCCHRLTVTNPFNDLFYGAVSSLILSHTGLFCFHSSTTTLLCLRLSSVFIIMLLLILVHFQVFRKV